MAGHQEVTQRISLETDHSPFVMEGGSITGNGKGTVIVSKLTRHRNPYMQVVEIEEELKKLSGSER